MHQDAQTVDTEEVANFIDMLTAFARRPHDLARSNRDAHFDVDVDANVDADVDVDVDVDPDADPDADAILRVTADAGVIQDVHRHIRLVAPAGAMAHAPPQLLSRVIAILQHRMRHCAQVCAAPQRSSKRARARTPSADAALGVLAASTVLTMLCAPRAPRNLLVEELLEDIVQVLRVVATLVIFPMCDPLYKAAKASSRASKKGQAKRPSRNDEVVANVDDKSDSDDDDSYNGNEKNSERRATTGRRSLLKMDETLLNHFYSFMNCLTLLFEKECFLPESIVSQSASVCTQSLPITGVVRLQSHAIKLVSMIFFCYPSLRVSILDDVRELVAVIPAARRHLRTYQLPEEKSAVRPSSALLCSLLCIASNDADKAISGKKNAKVTDENMDSWCKSRLKRHERAVKLAAHTLEPLFNRACGERDPEFKVAFQSFLEDLLTLYGRPEWPAAELMLQTLSVAIIKKLRGGEEKSVYARGMAIDSLGALASKMCDLYGSGIVRENDLSSPTEIGSESLEEEREKVLLFLYLDKSLQTTSAHAFLEALFLSDDHNVASNMRKRKKKELSVERDEMVDGSADEYIDGSDGAVETKEEMMKRVIENAVGRLQRVQSRQSRGEDVTRSEAKDAFQFVGVNRSFAGGFKTIMEAMFDGMHDPAPTIRAKSIKALSLIDETCHGLLRVFPRVLPYIEASCRDVSTLARDAALDLLSRNLLPDSTYMGGANGSHAMNHITQDPTLFNSIFQIVMKRMCDTATSVRKRAITITKAVLSDAVKSCNTLRSNPVEGADMVNEKDMFEERIIRICISLVSRLDDPESSVREAAERVLRFGLFGFDVTNAATWKTGEDEEDAHQLAERLTSVYEKLSTGIHMSFMSRVVHKAMLIKEKPLLMAIVSAAVEQLHRYEGQISQEIVGCNVKSLSVIQQKQLTILSTRRVGCSSVICAFGCLDASLIEPHCRSLAPSIKGVLDGSMSESDLVSVQRILNTLEVGLGRCKTLESGLLEEVLNDVEVIVCQSPTSILEEASVRCLCVVASKRKCEESESVVTRAANAFKQFLDRELPKLENESNEKENRRAMALERNARCAVMRLGLLARYGEFNEDFTGTVYATMKHVCIAMARIDGRGLLAKAGVRAMGHFLVRNRSFLPDGTKMFVSLMESGTCGEEGDDDKKVPLQNGIQNVNAAGDAVMSGVRLCILQGFHELLRDEEERNASTKDAGMNEETRKGSGSLENGKRTSHKKGVKGGEEEGSSKENVEREQIVLAAEEDAEAGFLALSAQAMLPSVKECASNWSKTIRRTVANIVGLLVRQGLVLPATVVPCLFTLLLDRDAVCREFAMRVITFLADRHSGMLASATVPAMRGCFTRAFNVYCASGLESKEGSGQLTIRKISEVAIDQRTGHCLLSGALMAIRREQRRGVLESLMREFDPRVVVMAAVKGEGATDEGSVKNGIDVDANIDADDDDVCTLGGGNMDLSECDGGGQRRCSLGTLWFLAMTLGCVDYTNGAGVGGSLSHGGGTAAAETKMKYAREDVNELVGIATRIISNSGQAILRVAKHVSKKSGPEVSKQKKRVADWAARMCVLLSLKYHLKVERWKNVGGGEDAKSEDEVSAGNCRMVEFRVEEGLWTGMEREADKSEGNGTRDAEADEQLEILFKLMRGDAIDEGDVHVPVRRGKGGRVRAAVKARNERNRTQMGGDGDEGFIDNGGDVTGASRATRASRASRSYGASVTSVASGAPGAPGAFDSDIVQEHRSGASTTPRRGRRHPATKRKRYIEGSEGSDGDYGGDRRRR